MLFSCRKQFISVKCTAYILSAGLSVFRIVPFLTPKTSETRSEALFVLKQHTGTTHMSNRKRMLVRATVIYITIHHLGSWYVGQQYRLLY